MNICYPKTNINPDASVLMRVSFSSFDSFIYIDWVPALSKCWCCCCCSYCECKLNASRKKKTTTTIATRKSWNTNFRCCEYIFALITVILLFVSNWNQPVHITSELRFFPSPCVCYSFVFQSELVYAIVETKWVSSMVSVERAPLKFCAVFFFLLRWENEQWKVETNLLQFFSLSLSR